MTTVPNERFYAVGPQAIRAEYTKWFSDPATFVALERTPDGKIASDTVWCGGKWPEPLLGDMAAAAEMA